MSKFLNTLGGVYIWLVVAYLVGGYSLAVFKKARAHYQARQARVERRSERRRKLGLDDWERTFWEGK